MADLSTAETPLALFCSSVVSRDSARLDFLVAVLNVLDVFYCDILNVYLNAPCKYIIWFQLGSNVSRYQWEKL